MAKNSSQWSVLFYLLIAACGTGDKGPEDDPFEDGKEDSYRSPTDMGDAHFGETVTAEITDDSKYHAWTFTLSRSADITLETKRANATVDTVMYLYKKSNDGWGSYIKKNDDKSSRTGLSKIKGEFGEGEYRVIVKFYKSTARGKYKFAPQCDGDGCPAPNSCFGDLPVPTGLTKSCHEKILGVWVGGPQDDRIERYGYSTNDLTCDGNTMAELAIGYYMDEDFDSRAEELEVRVWDVGEGTVVEVEDLWDDESQVSYLFDGRDELLVSFWHNQSSIVNYYCGEEEEEVIVEDFAYEGCVARMIETAGVFTSTTDFYSSDEATIQNLFGIIPEEGHRALSKFQSLAYLDDWDFVEAEWEQLDSHAGDMATLIRFEAYNGFNRTYYIARNTIIWESWGSDPDNIVMVCDDNY